MTSNGSEDRAKGSNNNGFLEYLKKRGTAVNREIDEALENKTAERYLNRLLGRSGYEYDTEAIEKSIIKPSKYLFDLGGKRWRPILMLTVIDALGKNSNNYIEFSLIPEIIHSGSLVHDDVEDNSQMRRGSDAVHVKYGLDVGVNLGDFLFFFPIVALLDTKKLSQEIKMRMLEIYQRNLLKITIGQGMDIAWHNFLVDPYKVTEKEYLQMANSKSGVLSDMAAELGAALCDSDDKTIKALGRFGSTIGIAFQLQDDMLNIFDSDVSDTKGGVGEDITEGKVSILVIYTLQHANEKDGKRLVEILKMHTKDKTLIKEAIGLIKKYEADKYVKELQERLLKEAWNGVEKLIPDSEAKQRLKEMAEFLVYRMV